MTLDEAIEHCEEKAQCGTACCMEHKQLAEWLKELKTLREEYEIKCCKGNFMTKEERKVLEDRLEYVRNKMMFYSNTGCAEYLALAKEENELTDKLGKSVEETIATFIVNKLGINLCSVKSINVDRQEDGQIKEIKIEFIPSNSED